MKLFTNFAHRPLRVFVSPRELSVLSKLFPTRHVQRQLVSQIFHIRRHTAFDDTY
jgi:hypothetical protein